MSFHFINELSQDFGHFLSEEDFLFAIKRIRHDVEQSADIGLKLPGFAA